MGLSYLPNPDLNTKGLFRLSPDSFPADGSGNRSPMGVSAQVPA